MQVILDGFSWLGDPANWAGPEGALARILEHLLLSTIALVIAAAIALPLGLYIGHTGRGRFVSVQVANIGRAVPSLAILGLMFLLAVEVVPGLAFGFLPTIVALAVLGIPVILINAYVGIDQVDADTVEAARGMGLSGRQILWRLEVPLAAPLIMTGLRLSAVQIVATAGLAALIGGGALGRLVTDGFYNQENGRMVAGTILIATLSVLTDAAFSLLARVTAPRLRSSGKRAEAAPPAYEQSPPEMIP